MTFTRDELEEFWESWLAVNREAERIGRGFADALGILGVSAPERM